MAGLVTLQFIYTAGCTLKGCVSANCFSMATKQNPGK